MGDQHRILSTACSRALLSLTVTHTSKSLEKRGTVCCTGYWGGCCLIHISLLFFFWKMLYFLFWFREEQGEAVSPDTYARSQKDLLCPLPIWESRVQCTPWSVLTLKIIVSSAFQEVTGKYKHNPGHTQWSNDYSLLSVCICIYFLMAFLLLHPCSKGKHRLHSEDMESRKRNLFSEAPLYNTMP